jgi:hypothetical protein
MADDQHHLYSASGSEGWLNCAGKIAMEQGRPDKGSVYADEGSAAHFVGAECLINNAHPSKYHGREVICYQVPGGRAGQCWSTEAVPKKAIESSRWPVNDEMVKHLNQYVTLVREHTRDMHLMVEKRVEFGDAIGLPGAFGTSDALALSNDDTTLFVGDLKYGHLAVDAVQNTQMMLYALGALRELEMATDPDKLRRIHMVIYQPRINNTSTWIIDISTLLEFAVRAAEAIQLSETARADFAKIENEADFLDWWQRYLGVSEKGCQWCLAKASCPKLAAENMNTLAMIPPAHADDLLDMDQPIAEQATALATTIDTGLQALPGLDFDTVVELFKALDKVEMWAEAIRGRVMYDMLNGHKHPDFKLVRGKQGDRKWRDEKEAELMLKAQKYKVEEMYTKKLITPTAAEKLTKAKPQHWQKLEAQITRAEGKIVIAPRSDKREPLDPYNDNLAQLPDLTTDDFY